MSDRDFRGKGSPRKRSRRSIPIEEVPSDGESDNTEVNTRYQQYAFVDEDEASVENGHLNFFAQSSMIIYNPVIEEPDEADLIFESGSSEDDEILNIVIRSGRREEIPSEDRMGSSFFPHRLQQRTRIGEFFDDFNNMFTDFNRLRRNMAGMHQRIQEEFQRFGSEWDEPLRDYPRSRFRQIPVHEEGSVNRGGTSSDTL